MTGKGAYPLQSVWPKRGRVCALTRLSALEPAATEWLFGSEEPPPEPPAASAVDQYYSSLSFGTMA